MLNKLLSVDASKYSELFFEAADALLEVECVQYLSHILFILQPHHITNYCFALAIGSLFAVCSLYEQALIALSFIEHESCVDQRLLWKRQATCLAAIPERESEAVQMCQKVSISSLLFMALMSKHLTLFSNSSTLLITITVA